MEYNPEWISPQGTVPLVVNPRDLRALFRSAMEEKLALPLTPSVRHLVDACAAAAEATFYRLRPFQVVDDASPLTPTGTATVITHKSFRTYDCPKCSRRLPAQAVYCPGCGRRIVWK